jgi:gamma-glutamyl:cysteine ligase YbdK (ATP-grasp superfamily)
MILMDYANRPRLEILGRVEIRAVDADANLASRIAVPASVASSVSAAGSLGPQ